MHKCKHNLPWEVVFPFCLQIEPCGFESIGLLLNCVSHHLPETFGHGKAQVSGRDLRRIDHATSEKFEEKIIFLDFEWVLNLIVQYSSPNAFRQKFSITGSIPNHSFSKLFTTIIYVTEGSDFEGRIGKKGRIKLRPKSRVPNCRRLLFFYPRNK